MIYQKTSLLMQSLLAASKLQCQGHCFTEFQSMLYIKFTALCVKRCLDQILIA